MTTNEPCKRGALALLLVAVAVGGCAVDIDEGSAARTDWALGDPNMSDHCYGAACCPLGLTKIVGTSGANVLNGTFGNDCLVGLQGNDTINGSDGGDTILCGPGADTCAGDLGEDTLLGSTENDQLLGGVSRDVLIGGLGNDTLRGGSDADTLVPGLGVDNALGEAGNDLILVNAACEISRGDRINGGDGTDTIQSPISLAQIQARGATITSVEVSNVVPRPQGWPNGSCYPTEIGFRCDCCDLPGLDPKRGCQECGEGYHRVYDVDPLGNDTPSSLGDSFRCEPDITCDDLRCGEHGTCVEENDTATCVCEQGYAGSSCTSCAPLYERTAFRQCDPSDDCDEELCNGHGQCVEQGDGTLGCDCDEGWDETPDCNGPDARIGGPDGAVMRHSTQEYAIGLRNGAHCTADFEWSVVEGSATIIPDAEDSKHIYLALDGATFSETPSMVKLRAECSNNPFLFAEHSQIVVTPDVQVQEINGTSRTEFEPFDDAMTQYIGDRQMHGATLAVSYLGNLMYLRAYGYRDDDEEVDMRTCTPMRVASVTKPFTRAGLVQQYGTALPAALGGGTLDATTPIVPIIDDILGVGPGNTVQWQAPASMYSATFPGPNCSTSDGLLHPNWLNIQVQDLLDHSSGLQPNQNFIVGTNASCTGAAGENCGSFSNVNDPTVSASSVTSIANWLNLDHGVPTTDELLRYMAGVCPYGLQTQNLGRYSNFGFTVAGRILERVTGQAYEPWTQNFLSTNGIIDVEAPGSPWWYQGRSYGDGPASGTLPAHLEESYYWSFSGEQTNVVTPVPVIFGSGWLFPFDSPAPYGARNYDLMATHGSVVTNVLALANFMRRFRLSTGALRGGAYPDAGASQGGALPGTSSLIWEVPLAEPLNTGNANGAGCLVPANVPDMGNVNGLNLLNVDPCPLPAGITIAVIFNSDPPNNEPWFVRGLHDLGLLQHVLREAASDVGATAAEWGALWPLNPIETQIGCELKCPASEPFCVPWQCGDGELQDGEECDDGDNFDDDGCEHDCTVTPADPQTPPGYDDCANENPGECLGGPCAHIDMQSGDRMNPQSEYHPDGNWSPDYYCLDSLELNPDDELGEITCVREEYGEQDWGVCLACGVDTFMGCVCPGSATDEGINGCDGLGEDLTCIGGRCWQDAPEYQPDWMCSADCRDIYGNSQGYCSHDGPKGAVCLPFSDCNEPVDGYCNIEGGVCDTRPAMCTAEDPNPEPLCNWDTSPCTADNELGCCEPECIDNDDCALRGYVGHICDEERCVNHAD